MGNVTDVWFLISKASPYLFNSTHSLVSCVDVVYMVSINVDEQEMSGQAV